MTATAYPIAQARPKLGDLVRRAVNRERITLSDHGRPVAVIISLVELEALESRANLAERLQDRAALAEYYVTRAEEVGETVTVAEARARLFPRTAA